MKLGVGAPYSAIMSIGLILAACGSSGGDGDGDVDANAVDASSSSARDAAFLLHFDEQTF